MGGVEGPLISVGFRAEPCDGVTELRYTRYCYSLYHLCPTEEEVPPISFFSSTPLEKTVSLRELTDAPQKPAEVGGPSTTPMLPRSAQDDRVFPGASRSLP